MASSVRGEDPRSDRVWSWLATGDLVFLVLGVGMALLAGAESSSPPLDQPSPWRENLSFALLAIGVALIVAAVVRMVRRRVSDPARRQLEATFTIAGRHQMVRWVRQGEAVPEAMAQPATVTAQAMVGRRKVALLYLGVALVMVGLALGTTSLWRLVIALFVAVVVMVALVVVRRDARLAQRWLESYAEPTTSEATAS